MKTEQSTIIEITIYDHNGKRLDDVKVSMKNLGERVRSTIIKYDKERRVYRSNDIDPGYYLIKAELDSFESQERKVTVNQSGLKDTFILGHKDMPFYYRGRTKVPFDPPRDL
jgi:hypothetical protein